MASGPERKGLRQTRTAALHKLWETRQELDRVNVLFTHEAAHAAHVTIMRSCVTASFTQVLNMTVACRALHVCVQKVSACVYFLSSLSWFPEGLKDQDVCRGRLGSEDRAWAADCRAPGVASIPGPGWAHGCLPRPAPLSERQWEVTSSED